MSNKTIGGQAKELVLLFYEKNELKFTNKDIMVSIKNAKRLLEAGYTYDEIKDTIEYCADNPPPKGIYSFGFITQLRLFSNQRERLRQERKLLIVAVSRITG